MPDRGALRVRAGAVGAAEALQFLVSGDPTVGQLILAVFGRRTYAFMTSSMALFARCKIFVSALCPGGTSHLRPNAP